MDDPEGALLLVHQSMDQWSHKGFHLQHHLGMMAEMTIYLYIREPAKAWEAISRQWTMYTGSLLWRVQQVRIDILQLRARAALAAIATARNPRSLLESAERDARRIHRERMPWGQALVQLVTAGIAATRRDTASAVDSLRRASTALHAVDMRLHAAAACYCLGGIIGGDEGRALVADAHCWMEKQGIRNVSRMVTMIAPGFGT
jgi:eukaryotic-like serine/threonine-protein kinase